MADLSHRIDAPASAPRGVRTRRRVAGILAVAGSVAALPAVPVAAQQARFEVPPGCTAFLTVQSSSCTVSHYWTCEADAPGTRWRVVIDGEGPFYLSHTDAEYRWLANRELRTGVVNRLVEPEEDPASVTELLETGNDSMAFTMRQQGGFGPAELRYSGFDALTGGEVEIDGERLLVTSFRYEYDAGDGLRRVSGNQFVHPELALFFGGIETTELATGERFEADHSPREFVEPGEPGFLTMSPAYDCGEVISALDPTGPVVPAAFRAGAAQVGREDGQ
ncbi:hypothetical protein HKCCE2091_16775 [Rhodobacterales bacterium HKCCE2091]|nr:hypothetical protein [Rhodobacterales bacterium HKCCE2091]